MKSRKQVFIHGFILMVNVAVAGYAAYYESYLQYAFLLAIVAHSIYVLRYLSLVQDTQKRFDEQLDSAVKHLADDGTQSLATPRDLQDRLIRITEFIREITKGNYKAILPGVTNKADDLNTTNLSGALITMQQKMISVAKEENERNWSNTGIARFSEIIRVQNKTLDEILQNFLNELIKYIGANQGGIFVVKDTTGEHSLELRACYAYGKKKFVEKIVAQGEGLIGQAYLEGDIIYLTDVPKDYIRITSGLGEALPRCVIVIPLKTHEKIEGVLEIASFQVWTENEVNFLKKISEILGAAIHNIRVNEITNSLLAESKHQSEQLRLKEEQLRQNLEEISATQEVMEKQSREAMVQNSKLNLILDSATDAIITTESTGTIESVNKAGQLLFGFSEKELIGEKITRFLPVHEDSLTNKHIHLYFSRNYNHTPLAERVEAVKKDGVNFPADLSINIADDGTRKLFTVIIRDITEQVKAENDQLQYIEELRAQEEELKQNMEELNATQEEIHRQLIQINKMNSELDARVAALDTSTIMSEADLFGTITYVNQKFCDVSQYTREELIGKPHKLLRHPDMPSEVFRVFWETIKAGKIFRGIVKNRKKDGTHYWVDAVISPVKDETGKITKYIGVRYVIEDDTQAQNLFDKQLKELGLAVRQAA